MCRYGTPPEESQHTSIKERFKPSLILSTSINYILQSHQFNHFNFSFNPLLAFDGHTTSKE
jgi:hypothetical protein